MEGEPKTSVDDSSTRTWLDVAGVVVLIVGYGYLCLVAPFIVFPIVALIAAPLFLLGYPMLIAGLVMLTGFNKGTRRSIIGTSLAGAGGVILTAACIMGLAEFASASVLRELVSGAAFPWDKLGATAGLSLLGGLAAFGGIYHSRDIPWWPAALIGLLSASLPVVLARVFVFLIILFDIPYTA